MIFEPRSRDQLEGIEFLVSNSHGGLFWDPGVGKTPVTLEAFKILRDEGLAKRMLVIASLNIVNDVWPEQIEKFDDLDLTYSHLHGKKWEGWEADADVYLMNYEGLPWLRKSFGRNHEFDVLVVDESSKFRNRGAKTLFGTLRWMLPSFKRRYVLTGTPIPRGYLGLWPQMYIVDLGRSLGDTLTGYKNRYFKPGGYMGYEWTLMPGAEEEIQRAIAPALHRAEKNIDVPIEFVDHTVRLPAGAMRAYRELEREFITEWRGKTLVAQNAAVATAKLRQAANGSVYYGKGKHRKRVVLHDRKMTKLSELTSDMRERGHSAVIGYEFGHDYEAIKKAVPDAPSYSAAPAGKRRTALKKQWNDKKLEFLASQIGAMSHGLNMQDGGWNVVYYGMTYNLEQYEQFYQRLWREGQMHGVRAHRIVTEGTIDEVQMRVLQDRGEDQQALLDAIRDHYKL